MRLISARRRGSSSLATVTDSPRTLADSVPFTDWMGTSPLPAMSPPRISAPASYALAAARNLRKARSEPCMSVAKKIRNADLLPPPPGMPILPSCLEPSGYSGGSSRMASRMSMEEVASLRRRAIK